MAAILGVGSCQTRIWDWLSLQYLHWLGERVSTFISGMRQNRYRLATVNQSTNNISKQQSEVNLKYTK